MRRRSRVIGLLAAVLAMLVCGVGAYAGWRGLQNSPAYQYRAARDRWETHRLKHYRIAANYSTNWAQCHYDIEVRDEEVRHVYGVTCLSAESAQTLTVSGIFRTFERYATGRVCAATGCYCDGTYALRATYDPEYGYPQRMTTRFVRNWLDDLAHGQFRKMSCLRADLTVERIEVVSLEPLP
jgi:hypothetical protein